MTNLLHIYLNFNKRLHRKKKKNEILLQSIDKEVEMYLHFQSSSFCLIRFKLYFLLTLINGCLFTYIILISVHIWFTHVYIKFIFIHCTTIKLHAL